MSLPPGQSVWAARIRTEMRSRKMKLGPTAKALGYSAPSFLSNTLNLHKAPSRALNDGLSKLLDLDSDEMWAMLHAVPGWADLDLTPDERAAVRRFAEALVKARRFDTLIAAVK